MYHFWETPKNPDSKIIHYSIALFHLIAVNLAAVIVVLTFSGCALFAVEGRAMAKVVPTIGDIEQINDVLSS